LAFSLKFLEDQTQPSLLLLDLLLKVWWQRQILLVFELTIPSFPLLGEIVCPRDVLARHRVLIDTVFPLVDKLFGVD
jgi:hypothetical protein